MLSLWQEVGGDTRVGRLTQADEIEELIGLFEAIAAEQGWHPGGALRQWEERSVYFGLRGGEPSAPLLGGLQLLFPEASGRLPCHALWPEAPLLGARASGQPQCAHIAMLGLVSAARGHPLHFWRLAIEMWRYCIAAHLMTLFIEVTPRVLPLYRHVGWPLTICGERRLHWGEECYLCRMELPEVARVLLTRAQNSPHYQSIIAQALRLS